MVQVTFTWGRLRDDGDRRKTICEALADRLGRAPTDAEAREEVRRILAIPAER
jgi:hypothetical protein